MPSTFDTVLTTSPATETSRALATLPPHARREEVRALTGLRGIAALLVSVYHIDPELRRFGAFGRFVGRGYLWVDVFFVLSGFVLALNYGAQFRSGWRGETWRAFLLRRVARVYPLYAVLLFGSLAYMAMGVGQSYVVPLLPYPHLAHPLAVEIANVFMVQSWGVGPSIDGTAWSLSAEAAAYVVFPLLAGLALFSRKRTAFALAIAAAAAIVVVAMLTRVDGEVHSGTLDAYEGATVEPLLRCVGGFVFGLLMFRLAQAGRVRAWLARDDVLAAVIVLLVAGFAYAPNDLYIYPLLPLLVLGIYGNRGAIGRVLGGGAIHRLGVTSYSFYLVHPYLVLPKRGLALLLGSTIGPTMADVIVSVAALAATLALSAASYRLIEEPGRRALNHVARAWTQRTAMQRSQIPSPRRHRGRVARSGPAPEGRTMDAALEAAELIACSPAGCAAPVLSALRGMGRERGEIKKDGALPPPIHACDFVHSTSLGQTTFGALCATTMPTWPKRTVIAEARGSTSASAWAESGGTMRSFAGRITSDGTAMSSGAIGWRPTRQSPLPGRSSPYQSRRHSSAEGSASGTPSLSQSSSATKPNAAGLSGASSAKRVNFFTASSGSSEAKSAWSTSTGSSPK